MKHGCLSFSVVGLFASVAHASGYLVDLGYGVPVNRYLMHSGGGMTIWVSGIANPDGCGAADKVHLKGDLPGHAKMTAAVMAAVAAGHKVGFYSSGCEIIPFWGGSVSYPVVSNLWVVK